MCAAPNYFLFFLIFIGDLFVTGLFQKKSALLSVNLFKLVLRDFFAALFRHPGQRINKLQMLNTFCVQL